MPLPPNDRNGASIGFLVQALALRRNGRLHRARATDLDDSPVIRPRHCARNDADRLRRASAAAVLWVMTWFGVGANADYGALYFEFLLVSLAITASTAGAVASRWLGGRGSRRWCTSPSGVVVSGASIPPEFLPSFWRWFGQALPTGSECQRGQGQFVLHRRSDRRSHIDLKHVCRDRTRGRPGHKSAPQSLPAYLDHRDSGR